MQKNIFDYFLFFLGRGIFSLGKLTLESASLIKEEQQSSLGCASHRFCGAAPLWRASRSWRIIMGSRFVVGCERAEDPNDVEKAASTSEMSVALKARKGKNNDNKNNKNNNKKANNDARHAFETKSPWGIYTHPAMLFALGMLLGVLVRFSYTTVGQRHVRAHKDAWQAYMETYREHMYGHNNDTIALF